MKVLGETLKTDGLRGGVGSKRLEEQPVKVVDAARSMLSRNDGREGGGCAGCSERIICGAIDP